MRGTARGELRVIKGLLPNASRQAGRKLGGRVHIAEKNSGDAVPALDSGAPGFEDCRDVGGSPLELKRPTGHHDQDYGLAGSHNGLQQLLLRTSETQGSAAGSLALHQAAALAQGEDGDIGVFGHLNRLGDGLGVIGDEYVHIWATWHLRADLRSEERRVGKECRSR